MSGFKEAAEHEKERLQGFHRMFQVPGGEKPGGMRRGLDRPAPLPGGARPEFVAPGAQPFGHGVPGKSGKGAEGGQTQRGQQGFLLRRRLEQRDRQRREKRAHLLHPPFGPGLMGGVAGREGIGRDPDAAEQAVRLQLFAEPGKLPAELPQVPSGQIERAQAGGRRFDAGRGLPADG